MYQQPLEQLSFDNLERYIWKAMTTWGDVEDFKHYLPRILEFLATLGDGFKDVFIVGSKLEHACLKEWPENEQLAVNEFFRAW